jgi:hypothetical protein
MIELAGLGWALVWPFQECMGIVKIDRVLNWVQLSSKRLSLNADSLPEEDTPFRAAVGEAIGWNGTNSLLDLDDEQLIDLCQKLSDKEEDSSSDE